MKQYTTKGIVLTRTDFGEADRIITFLTPDQGKVRAVAKAVRKEKSKLAGGIELFSISDLTLIVGKGDIDTLISTRLIHHFHAIVKDLERTQAAYDFMKLLNRGTEDNSESAYFDLLQKGLESLDDPESQTDLTVLWFKMQLLKLAGHAPNLKTDANDKKLQAARAYSFDLERMRFTASAAGIFDAKHIKFLRLGFGAVHPRILHKVEDGEELAGVTDQLVQSMLKTFIRI